MNNVPSEDYCYIMLDDGTVKIDGYSGTDTEIIIPKQLDGYKVTSIGEEAFLDLSGPTSITIPDSVKTVDKNPFLGCKKLAKIIVSPDHPILAVIDGVLFSKQDKRLVCYPGGKQETEYQIPSGIQIIGDDAFSECSSLATIAIPDSVTSIGDEVFSFCSSLTSVAIPDSVIKIGVNPFISCDKLIKISVSPDQPALAVIDSVLFSKQDKRLICYPEGKLGIEYQIPFGIQIIGDYAFCYCSSLKTIKIPDSVTSIGDWAFSSCSSLTTIKIPDSVTSIGNYAFSRCSSLTTITIPASVISIGRYTFSNCSSLTTITIPDSVTSIGNRAFHWCSSLTSITIPDSVTTIGDEAFSSCSSLTSITIPDSVTSIGDYSFSSCSSLTSVAIPDSVIKIGVNPFRSCDKLIKIFVSPDQPALAVIDSVLFSKQDKRLICYPEGKLGIEYQIPSGIQIIGDYAFYGCDNLTSITIPNSVTSIGDKAFYGCSKDLLVTVGRESYARMYCKDHGLNYTYPDINDWLNN